MYLELQNGKEPALDDWNWHELDLAVLRTWTTVFPRTVSDVLARYAPPGPTDRSTMVVKIRSAAATAASAWDFA